LTLSKNYIVIVLRNSSLTKTLKIMKKQQFQRILSRFAVILIMAVILHFLLQLRESTVAIVYWSVASLMIINFWLHIEQEKKDNFRHFFLTLAIAAIMLIMNLLTLIGYIIQAPTFQGPWAKIFGWHGFIIMMLITAYALMLFDKSCRDDLKCWLNKKIRI
jgi:NADH:ubiquinone oxidoreductase subunit 2 (subunit N)